MPGFAVGHKVDSTFQSLHKILNGEIKAVDHYFPVVLDQTLNEKIIVQYYVLDYKTRFF